MLVGQGATLRWETRVRRGWFGFGRRQPFLGCRESSRLFLLHKYCNYYINIYHISIVSMIHMCVCSMTRSFLALAFSKNLTQTFPSPRVRSARLHPEPWAVGSHPPERGAHQTLRRHHRLGGTVARGAEEAHQRRGRGPGDLGGWQSLVWKLIGLYTNNSG